MECGKEGHIRAQYPEKLKADARRKQFVAAQVEIGIVEELEEKKPPET